MSRVSLGSRLGFGCAARQGRSARAQHDRGTRQEEVQVLQVQVKHLKLKEQKGARTQGRGRGGRLAALLGIV